MNLLYRTLQPVGAMWILWWRLHVGMLSVIWVVVGGRGDSPTIHVKKIIQRNQKVTFGPPAPVYFWFSLVGSLGPSTSDLIQTLFVCRQ